MSNADRERYDAMVLSLSDSFAAQVGSLLPQETIDSIVKEVLSETGFGEQMLREVARSALKEAMGNWMEENTAFIMKAADDMIAEMDPAAIVTKALGALLTTNLVGYANNIESNLSQKISMALSTAVDPFYSSTPNDINRAMDEKIQAALNVSPVYSGPTTSSINLEREMYDINTNV